MSDLIHQRSVLVILLASCTAARTVFERAENAIDDGLHDALTKLIDRSQAELTKLNGLIADSRA
jgi:hypothetical protein